MQQHGTISVGDLRENSDSALVVAAAEEFINKAFPRILLKSRGYGNSRSVYT